MKKNKPAVQPHPVHNACYAALSAQQMEYIGQRGGHLELSLISPQEGIDPYRRAFLHLDCPAAIEAFLAAVTTPGTRIKPGQIGHKGFCPPQRLVAFGFFDCQGGGFLISQFAPAATATRLSALTL